ncbi:transcriptional regulator [uncultured Roseibium sp.]|uniref:winged helix-turn-helix domain-containing protein n=1 Tax=uncultured Roseibium sp. TaxID=1936171 RepID=UPI00260BD76F|nr:transcriptional regulator [uncultured Roseibium sp.]
MIYKFSDCILDLGRRTLSRDGGQQHIEPQVFDLLAFLVQSSGRTITKEDLVTAIWGGRAISDDAITSRIKSARKAIGDDGRAQRLIRTLPRVGYRFDGSVEAIARAETPEQATISATS